MGLSVDHSLAIYFESQDKARAYYDAMRQYASHSDRIVWDNFDDYDLDAIATKFGVNYDWAGYDAETFFLTLDNNRVALNSGGYGDVNPLMLEVAEKFYSVIGYISQRQSCQCVNEDTFFNAYNGLTNSHRNFHIDDYDNGWEESGYENEEYDEAEGYYENVQEEYDNEVAKEVKAHHEALYRAA